METTIVFNIGVGTLIIGILTFFSGLLAIVWKGKDEIADAVKKEIDPLKRTTSSVVQAMTEVHTTMRDRFPGLVFTHTLVERGTSPVNPTEYGASLIKDSGLEKILNDNKEILRTKLEASLPTPHAEYDVQERARDLLVSLKDDPMMIPLKEWVYNNPINIDVVLRVGGLWLRDDFLSKPRKVSKKEE